MRIKAGASINGIRPEIAVAITAIQDIINKWKEPDIEFVITSGTDGKHSPTSLHHAGCAIDIRTRMIPPHQRGALKGRIEKALGRDFEIVLEDTHIHLEFQPRYRS